MEQSLPCSVNGLLAVELALDTSSGGDELWRTSLPTLQDSQSSMPAMWPIELQRLLTYSAQLILRKQQKKISRDWEAVSPVFPNLSYDIFRHYWLVVSTRTFYYTAPGVESPPEDPDECLALIPYADYFNHSDEGCEVYYNTSVYEFRADRRYKAGEEVFMSYGDHSNDFLLVEYGFILEESRWDQACLDEVVTPLFSHRQAEVLREEEFWLNYILDYETDCRRTRLALGLLCMPLGSWRRAVAVGCDYEDKYRTAIDDLLLDVLHSYEVTVEDRICIVNLILARGVSSQCDILRRRWEQVRLLVSDAISCNEED